MPLVETLKWETWMSGICTPHPSSPYISICWAWGQWDFLALDQSGGETLFHLNTAMSSKLQDAWIWRTIQHQETFSPHFLLAVLKAG